MTEVIKAKAPCPYLDQLYNKDPKIVDDIIEKYNTWCNIDLNGPDYIGSDEWCNAQELKNNYPELSKALWCEAYAAATVELAKRPKTPYIDLVNMGLQSFPDYMTIRRYNFKDKDYYYPIYAISTVKEAVLAWTENTGKPIQLFN